MPRICRSRAPSPQEYSFLARRSARNAHCPGRRSACRARHAARFIALRRRVTPVGVEPMRLRPCQLASLPVPNSGFGCFWLASFGSHSPQAATLLTTPWSTARRSSAAVCWATTYRRWALNAACSALTARATSLPILPRCCSWAGPTTIQSLRMHTCLPESSRSSPRYSPT